MGFLKIFKNLPCASHEELKIVMKTLYAVKEVVAKKRKKNRKAFFCHTVHFMLEAAGSTIYELCMVMVKVKWNLRTGLPVFYKCLFTKAFYWV